MMICDHHLILLALLVEDESVAFIVFIINLLNLKLQSF